MEANHCMLNQLSISVDSFEAILMPAIEPDLEGRKLVASLISELLVDSNCVTLSLSQLENGGNNINI